MWGRDSTRGPKLMHSRPVQAFLSNRFVSTDPELECRSPCVPRVFSGDERCQNTAVRVAKPCALFFYPLFFLPGYCTLRYFLASVPSGLPRAGSDETGRTKGRKKKTDAVQYIVVSFTSFATRCKQSGQKKRRVRPSERFEFVPAANVSDRGELFPMHF